MTNPTGRPDTLLRLGIRALDPMQQYGMLGFGGRAPVALLVDDPACHAPLPARRPTVAILDTGLGTHP